MIVMTEEALPTSKEFAHFAAVAAGKAAEEEDRFDRALNIPPGERILAGLQMGDEVQLTPAHLAELDARADGQMELARRRIALGLGQSRANERAPNQALGS